MTRSVNNVDAVAFVVYRRVFGKNCDASLTFKVIGVHYPVLHLFIGAENTALPQKLINKGRFTVVNMRNDRNVANLFVHNITVTASAAAKASFQLFLIFKCFTFTENIGSAIGVFVHLPDFSQLIILQPLLRHCKRFEHYIISITLPEHSYGSIYCHLH